MMLADVEPPNAESTGGMSMSRGWTNQELPLSGSRVLHNRNDVHTSLPYAADAQTPCPARLATPRKLYPPVDVERRALSKETYYSCPSGRVGKKQTAAAGWGMRQRLRSGDCRGCRREVRTADCRGCPSPTE